MTECIEWWMEVDRRSGYGSRHIRWRGRGTRVRAHRFVWEECFGPIPPGMNVLHRCDRRSCVNPEHLFLGTNGDNNRDRAMKGRSAVGSRNGNVRLTEAQVPVIRAKYQAGASKKGLAREYGVRDSTIYKVVHGLTWREA